MRAPTSTPLRIIEEAVDVVWIRSLSAQQRQARHAPTCCSPDPFQRSVRRPGQGLGSRPKLKQTITKENVTVVLQRCSLPESLWKLCQLLWLLSGFLGSGGEIVWRGSRLEHVGFVDFLWKNWECPNYPWPWYSASLNRGDVCHANGWCIQLETKKNAYFSQSIAREMGGVSRHFLKVRLSWKKTVPTFLTFSDSCFTTLLCHSSKLPPPPQPTQSAWGLGFRIGLHKGYTGGIKRELQTSHKGRTRSRASA